MDWFAGTGKTTRLTDDPSDLKQWIGLQVQEKQRALQELEELQAIFEQEKKAKQEFEELIAMIAHQFRGSLRNIKYNTEHNNPKTRTIKSVRTLFGKFIFVMPQKSFSRVIKLDLKWVI